MIRTTAGVLVLLAGQLPWLGRLPGLNGHTHRIGARGHEEVGLRAAVIDRLSSRRGRAAVLKQRVHRAELLDRAPLDAVDLIAGGEALLELAANKDERHAIREQYQLLFKILSGEIKLDRELIEKIKLQEKDHLALIRTLYKAKIQSLRSLIQSLEQKKGH